MLKAITGLLFLLFTLNVFAQTPIDTIDSKGAKVIIYANKTWAYLEDKKFNGVMNQHLHDLVTSDPNLGFVQSWNNDICFTTSRNTNDMSKLKDTIWLCVNDESDEAFVMPVPGRLTSKFGPRKGRNHNGVDLDLETGDTVRACWSGKIRYAKYNGGGFGNLVIIRHNNGLESFYAHLSKIVVAPNQVVKAGDMIGLGGNTGRSFGSHLHFEIRFYDAAMNPEEVIDFNEKKCHDHNLFVHKSLFKPSARTFDSEAEEAEQKTSEATGSTATTVSATPVNVDEELLESAHKYYRVKTGDTLIQIAEKNKTTVSKICQLNGIRPTSTLQIGRSLRVK